MLQSIFGINDESEMSAPGFHSTPNIPANFIWPGIDKFLNELDVAPPSILHQVPFTKFILPEERIIIMKLSFQHTIRIL